MGIFKNKKENEKTNKKEMELVTKESLCAVCALFSLIALFMLFTRSVVFGGIGLGVHSFLIGLFGYMAYPVFLGALYLSSTGLIGKRLVKNRKAGVWIGFTVASLALMLHISTTYSWEDGGYIVNCFRAGANFPKSTVCGFVGALITYPVISLASKAGAIVIFAVFTLFFGYLTYVSVKYKKQPSKQTAENVEATANSMANAPVEIPLTQAVQASQVVQSSSEGQPMQTPVNAYGEVTVRQHPEVLLSDEVAQTSAGQKTAHNGAFSPFGTTETMREPTDEFSNYQSTREFLFGGTPAENYQRNLIFDPNARVNKRPNLDANGNATHTTVQSGYAPSYTEAYQSSINDTVVERPTKIVADFTSVNNTQNSYEEPAQNRSYEKYEGEITPLRLIEQQTERLSSFETPIQSTPNVEDTRAYENEASTETLRVENETDGYRRHDYMDLFSPANPNVFGSSDENRAFAEETFSRNQADELSLQDRENIQVETGNELVSRDLDDDNERGRGISIFDDEEVVEDRMKDRNSDSNEDPYSLRSDFSERSFERASSETESRFGRNDDISDDITFSRGRDLESVEDAERVVERVQVQETKPEPPALPKPRIIRPYVRVPLDDFDCRDVEPTSNMEEVEETKANIIATLDDFKVTGASISSVTFGPTVTRYNVTIPRNISPRKVVALDQSIAISLHSAGVNIYPNYEDGVVSIEVPNKERQFVQLGCMLTGDTYVNAKPSSIMFTMGKDVGNRKVYGDISKMIHLLVAGSSGSGKSVFLGSLIISLIYKYSPEELRLILIDPKKTEFVLYNNLPHLMINEIITDVNKAVQSLNWAIGEMNRRYGLFEQMSRSGTYVVNLDDYNSHVEKADKLPKIVIIIDELADLMLAAKKDIEDRIQNLTQKARAAGIHLIVATQRPSIDVITGVIKSNLPTRIAFAVATDVDSRVILDQTGAQKLLGKGDFLYTMQGINTPVRVQSAFISASDSQRVVNFIKQNNEAYYDESATAYINNTRGNDGGSGSFGGSDEVEAVYIDALRFVILSGSASISMIQRKCSVGYNKAGKIVEWMEDMGYISSFDGAKARKVLITKEEFESKYGTL